MDPGITRYSYDGPNVLMTYDGNNRKKNVVVHGLDVDDQLLLEKDGNEYYFHKDGLGSVNKLTDISGNIVFGVNYDSFGNPSFQTTSVKTNYTYTGREYDEDTGLYYYRARWYDAHLGRFISEDPIGLLGGINKFEYVANSPVNRRDPLGLLNIIGGIGGSVIGVTGVEGSVGVVLNTNGGLNNIGFTGSGGIGGGLNISGDVYAGFITDDISNVSGKTHNINLVGGPVSVTVFTDMNGNVIGGTIGVGPGIPVGASGTYNNTGVLTLQNIWDSITGKPKPQTAPCH